MNNWKHFLLLKSKDTSQFRKTEAFPRLLPLFGQKSRNCVSCERIWKKNWRLGYNTCLRPTEKVPGFNTFIRIFSWNQKNHFIICALSPLLWWSVWSVLYSHVALLQITNKLKISKSRTKMPVGIEKCTEERQKTQENSYVYRKIEVLRNPENKYQGCPFRLRDVATEYLGSFNSENKTHLSSQKLSWLFPARSQLATFYQWGTNWKIINFFPCVGILIVQKMEKLFLKLTDLDFQTHISP